MQPSTRRLVLLLLLTGNACDGKAPATRARPSAPSPPAAVTPPESHPRPIVTPLPPPPAPPVIGMEDPFGRMKQAQVNTLNAGYRAFRQKKMSQAREAFHAVVAAYPDQVGARFEELRAAVAERDHAAVPELWRKLLERDFVGYADRLERAKEMASLRASPEWAQVQAIKAEVKARHGSGLGQGFLFVARARPHGTPTFADYSDTAALEQDQEVYHFDPATKRFRRLTETGGHVVALHREGNKLIVFTAKTLKKVEGGTAFSKPEAILLSLDTLEKTGPIAIDGDTRSAALCFSPKGEPIWTVNGAVETRTLTLDATGSALVAVEEGCSATLATTLVDPIGIQLHRPDPEGVALSQDGLQVTGVDGDKPVRASQSIRPGSLSWSPGKKRFVYAGHNDRCAKVDDKQKGPPNALLVWDAAQKKALRLNAEPASYETQWLDDDHLAYESRTGNSARLTVHDFTAGGAPLTLKTPAGAGLYGMPTVPCPSGELALVR
jgi:hypothetical protein